MRAKPGNRPPLYRLSESFLLFVLDLSNVRVLRQQIQFRLLSNKLAEADRAAKV